MRIISLPHRRDFLRIRHKGVIAVQKGVIIQYYHNQNHFNTPTENYFRLGLTASLKVGNAVKRNRARRKLRALAHELLPALDCHQGDYVFIARARTVKQAHLALKKDVIMALNKIKNNIR